MKIKLFPIPGSGIVETDWHIDTRGGFARFFCDNELSSVLAGRKIVQINQSKTIAKGTIRGLHFQHVPYAEIKFVRCTKGGVFDVLVDLRRDSDSYLKWHSEILTPENARMMVVPEGCAHGFQVLEPDTELLYLHTAAYSPDHEGGVMFDDPAIGIDWPLEAVDVSDRDLKHPIIDEKFLGIEL